MISSRLVGMTAPTFANEDVQPTPIIEVQPDSNSQDNGTGSSTTDNTGTDTNSDEKANSQKNGINTTIGSKSTQCVKKEFTRI